MIRPTRRLRTVGMRKLLTALLIALLIALGLPTGAGAQLQPSEPEKKQSITPRPTIQLGNEAIIIVGDAASGGSTAANDLAARWRQAGYRSTIITPSNNLDLQRQLQGVANRYMGRLGFNLRHLVFHFVGRTTNVGRSLFIEPPGPQPFPGTYQPSIADVGGLIGGTFPASFFRFSQTSFSTIIDACGASGAGADHLASLRTTRNGRTTRGYYSSDSPRTGPFFFCPFRRPGLPLPILAGTYSTTLPSSTTPPGFGGVETGHSAAITAAQANGTINGNGTRIVLID